MCDMPCDATIVPNVLKTDAPVKQAVRSELGLSSHWMFLQFHCKLVMDILYHGFTVSTRIHQQEVDGVYVPETKTIAI